MLFKLPELPYELNALEPHVSKDTMEVHHGKHHAKYIETLNSLIEGIDYEKMSLREIMFESIDRKDQKVFNNAGQSWNHTFFWHCMTPEKEKKELSSDFKKVIEKNFGSFDEFKNQFIRSAMGQFGSGWTWLVKDQDDTLSIMSLSNAGNPMLEGKSPILTCDVWEHAYYLDYKNEREKFVRGFFDIINWQFVESNYERYLDRTNSFEIKENLWL